MISRCWYYRGQSGTFTDKFRTMSFILEESLYDFEHVQNATVCLYLNLTTCLFNFIHTIIQYFYSKWILLIRVKTLFYRTLLLWCTSNIFKHLYSYLDFIRFPWQSLHPWKKSFILISFMNQNNAHTSITPEFSNTKPYLRPMPLML